MNAFDIIKERGFIYQLTDEELIRERLNGKNATFYVGIDPTADSLHIGHLLPLMACRWLYKGGHRPILLLGGGTAMIGDPSGKTEVRQLLDTDELIANTRGIEKQLRGLFDDSPGDESVSSDSSFPKILNNCEWLRDLNYIDFLREIGRHFSINRMLAADSVKLRLETGLSFLEFNYMLLQAYDFFILARDHDCDLQLGGQDQWGNIVAGVDLIRRLLGKQAYGATFPLLTDRNGQKFGKTVDGAIWLDEKKTSIFDYYQFWRNVDDAEVAKLLALYTDLPIEEVRRLGSLNDPEINRAKEILAFEATVLVHGAEAATRTFISAGSQFGFADPEGRIETSSSVAKVDQPSTLSNLPTSTVKRSEVVDGLWVVKLFVDAGLEKSNGAVRRLIQAGGAYIDDTRISDVNREVGLDDFRDGELLIRAGKKNIRRVVIEE